MNEDERRQLQQLAAQVQRNIEPSLRAMAEWQRQWQRQIGELGRIQLPGQMIADLRKFQDWFSAHQTEIAAALQALRTGLRRALSDNLHSLETDVAIAALELMSKEDGVVVVWLPPAEVVEQLVDADTMAARDAVLVARSAEIAAAATEILGYVDSPRLQPLTSALAEAWAVCEAGHRMAAQALATAALGTIVHDLLSYDKFADLKTDWRDLEALDDWPLIELRYGLLMYRTAIAVEQTHLGLAGYNRHGSAHKVDPTQYTEANALHSLMLVTAWARELQALDAMEPFPDA